MAARLKKDAAHVDEWPEDLTPSAELRRWYHARGGSFEGFAGRYEAEPAAPEAAGALARVREPADDGLVTPLTASRDLDRGHTAVLARLLGED